MEMYCHRCRRLVHPNECGRSRASSRYCNIHYCCPYCGALLNTRLVEC